MELDFDSFSRIHLNCLQEDARDFIQNYSSSALGFGGDKKTVQKHLDPYMKILKATHQPDSQESKPTPQKNNGFKKLGMAFGSGF